MGNTEFIISKFREYYRNTDVMLPPRFTRREYGFMFFDKKYVLRHISFKSKTEMKNFLVSNVPKHAYYSTAYYEDPSNKDMEKKGWLGADLIFDLDADHLPESEGMSYPEMLWAVKKEAEKLVKDFLMNDFGFEEKDITIAFSGGRGFHIYVRRGDVYTLKSDERREIVSYITGEGADILKFMNVYTVKKKRGRGSEVVYHLYPPDTGGWYGKVSRGIRENIGYLHDLYHNYGKEALFHEIYSVLRHKKLANTLVKDLLKEIGPNTKKIDYLYRSERSEKVQILEILSDSARNNYLNYLKEKLRIRGEADEPVTTDIHRLIRLIGSLHGKTGFIVRQLSFKDFLDFNPLNPEHISKYLIPKTFKNGKSKIITEKKVELPFEIQSVEGEECVPDYVAIFLIARNMGSFISRC